MAQYKTPDSVRYSCVLSSRWCYYFFYYFFKSFFFESVMTFIMRSHFNADQNPGCTFLKAFLVFIPPPPPTSSPPPPTPPFVQGSFRLNVPVQLKISGWYLLVWKAHNYMLCCTLHLSQSSLLLSVLERVPVCFRTRVTPCADCTWRQRTRTPLL